MGISPRGHAKEVSRLCAKHRKEVTRLTAEGTVLKTAIAKIAGQKLTDEMDCSDADFEYAYEEMIRVARVASDAVQAPVSGTQRQCGNHEHFKKEPGKCPKCDETGVYHELAAADSNQKCHNVTCDYYGERGVCPRKGCASVDQRQEPK